MNISRYPPPKTNQLGSAKRRSAGSNSTSIAVTAPVVSNGSIQKAAQPPSEPVPVHNDLEQQERVRKYQVSLVLLDCSSLDNGIIFGGGQQIYIHYQ